MMRVERLGHAAQTGAVRYRGWRWLGSLKLSLVVFVLFGIGVIGAYFGGLPPTWGVALPLGLFSVNLLAAIAVHPALRRRTALLVFHLALLALAALLAASRLSYLDGHVELAEGEIFTGELTGYEAGPLHPWDTDQVRFTQGPFTIHYEPGLSRDETRSRVALPDGKGGTRWTTVGDDEPLVVAGYRFYTTHNKGFAPTFRWYPENGGTPQRGTIHLPSYPAHEARQALTWSPPGSGLELWTQLRFDETILDPQRPSRFRVPREHHLVVRLGEARHELLPGDRLFLPGGRLEYEGLRTWMGYQVFYDWTIPWLLAACVVAMVSLGSYYWQRFAQHPWRDD